MNLSPERVRRNRHPVRAVTADLARSLGEVFPIAPRTLLELQKMFELDIELERTRPPDPVIGRVGSASIDFGSEVNHPRVIISRSG